ncbi:MAG: hypothetical protein ACPGXK_09515 [Phycisphaerae bacterium]
MINRALTLGLILGVASAASAQISVELRPQAGGGGSEFNLCGQVGANETVTFDVVVTQNGGSDILLRMVKMDFDGGDVAPNGISFNDAAGDATHHYVYSSGNTHAIVHAGPLPPNPLPGPGDLGPNASTQFNLAGTGEVKVAEITVQTPGTPGAYNLMADTSVHWGFGLGDGDISSVAGAASASLSVGNQNLTAAAPGFAATLPRSAGNVVRLTFDSALNAPNAGDIEIVELLAGGATGSDLSGGFAFEIEGGNTMKISGNGLEHGKWYEIRNLGNYADAGPFRVQYQVAVGDANGDGRVLPNDLSAINTDVPNLGAADDSRFDINGDGRVLPNDLSAANSSIPYLGTALPSGHSCN